MTSAEANPRDDAADIPVHVLVVGAGPTGRALAAGLTAFGTKVQVVDGNAHPIAVSRELAPQSRPLEVRRGFRHCLLERANPPSNSMARRAPDRDSALFHMGMDDTPYSFLVS